MSKAAELAKIGEVATNGQIGGRRNIVINGGMKVAQRATSVTGLGADGNTYNTLDRFQMLANATAGRFTMSQTAITDLPGFANCLKLDCTTADASIAAGEYLIVGQNFEGQDLQQIKKGTSDAEKLTVSFYVKGNANATYVFEILDADNNRQISKTFAVTTAWTRIIMTFPADTTGAIDDDNAQSLRLFIWLHAGSTYASGTLNSSSWATSTAANRAVGGSSFFDATSRTFFITGYQLEVGSVATPFENRSFGEELALCQRYFEKSYAQGTDPATATSASGIQYRYSNSASMAANYGQHHTRFAVYKRAAPTVVIFSTDGTSAHVTAEGGASGNKNVEVTHSAEGGVSINTTEVTDQNTFHFTADTEL